MVTVKRLMNVEKLLDDFLPDDAIAHEWTCPVSHGANTCDCGYDKAREAVRLLLDVARWSFGRDGYSPEEQSLVRFAQGLEASRMARKCKGLYIAPGVYTGCKNDATVVLSGKGLCAHCYAIEEQSEATKLDDGEFGKAVARGGALRLRGSLHGEPS